MTLLFLGFILLQEVCGCYLKQQHSGFLPQQNWKKTKPNPFHKHCWTLTLNILTFSPRIPDSIFLWNLSWSAEAWNHLPNDLPVLRNQRNCCKLTDFEPPADLIFHCQPVSWTGWFSLQEHQYSVAALHTVLYRKVPLTIPSPCNKNFYSLPQKTKAILFWPFKQKPNVFPGGPDNQIYCHSSGAPVGTY